MQKTKTFAWIFYLCLMGISAGAQNEKKADDDKNKEPLVTKKNVIKLNLSALAFKNISVQYERGIGKKTSLALSVRTIPLGSLPFQSTFKNIGDNSDVQYDLFKLGSFGVTPELRWYVGRKGALHGFYLAPFFNYNSYTTTLPIKYTSGATTKNGLFDGKLSTSTGGLQLGTQFSLGKNVVLDWWILGPNYGSASGTLNFASTLTAQEQTDLKTELEKIKNDVPFNAIKSYTVSSTGASIIAKGPWGGLRGLGFSLGIRF